MNSKDKDLFKEIGKIISESKLQADSYVGENRLNHVLKRLMFIMADRDLLDDIIYIGFNHEHLNLRGNKIWAAGLNLDAIDKSCMNMDVPLRDFQESMGARISMPLNLHTSRDAVIPGISNFFEEARSVYQNNICGNQVPESARLLSRFLSSHCHNPNYFAISWDLETPSTNDLYWAFEKPKKEDYDLVVDYKKLGGNWFNNFADVLGAVSLVDLARSSWIRGLSTDIDNMRSFNLERPSCAAVYLAYKIIQFHGAFGGKYFMGIPIHITRRRKTSVSLMSVVSRKPLSSDAFKTWVIIACILYKDLIAEELEEVNLERIASQSMEKTSSFYSLGHPLKRRTEPILNVLKELTPDSTWFNGKSIDDYKESVRETKKKIEHYSQRLSRFGTVLHLISITFNRIANGKRIGPDVFAQRREFAESEPLELVEMINNILNQEMLNFTREKPDLKVIREFPYKELFIEPWIEQNELKIRPNSDFYGFLLFELIHNSYKHSLMYGDEKYLSVGRWIKIDIKEDDLGAISIFIKNSCSPKVVDGFEKYSMKDGKWYDTYLFEETCGGLWNVFSMCDLTEIGKVEYRYIKSDDSNSFELKLRLFNGK